MLNIQKNLEIKTKKGIIDLNKPCIMGILNVTPDSFYDGNKYYSNGKSIQTSTEKSTEKAVAQAKKMILEGAKIIDVGGESSRPGSEPVSFEEELRRVIPVITKISRQHPKIVISVDTCKPKVAEGAIRAGADIINDITGLKDPQMCEVGAKHNVPVIIMHMKGNPKTMQENPKYNDVVDDIKFFFKSQIQKAKLYGIKQIILDPGIGFGKTLDHNLEIIRRLNEFNEFKELGYPVLIGVSRKSFISMLNIRNHNKSLSAEDRLPGTVAANVMSIINGANIIRVHDVKEHNQMIDLIMELQHGI